MNELIFLVQALATAFLTVCSLHFGPAAVIALVGLQCVLANVFVLQQINLLGLVATSADSFTIGATLGLNMLQEYFGKDAARTSIWVNFGALLFFGLSSMFQLTYTPASVDTMHVHYVALFSPAFRIIVASFTVFLIAQHVDYVLYGWLKKLFINRFLIIRNYGSVLVSQLLDTILFSFLGLYGLIDNVWHIIVISYAVKVCAILIATPIVRAARFFLPEK